MRSKSETIDEGEMGYDWDELLDGQIRQFTPQELSGQSLEEFLRQAVVEAVVVRGLEFRCAIETEEPYKGSLMLKASGQGDGPVEEFF